MSEALARATRDFFTARMLGLVLWPLLGSLLLWIGLAWAFWGRMVDGLQHALSQPAFHGWFGDTLLHLLSIFGVGLVLVLVIWPLVQATALLITATVALPVMTEFVAQRSYPQLERRKGGSIVGSVWNVLFATVIFLVLWIVTLPLWFFALPALVLPVLLNGWLNDRVFRYDALAEHASSDEYAVLSQRLGGNFFLLGCAGALLQLVPLLNLAAPVFAGLSFLHYGCAELERLRAESGTTVKSP
ncbi:MAG: EI24 domain-containing protein [Nevskia sp.]|nr:EI24 domain-containing protein [Nevskia sp.]